VNPREGNVVIFGWGGGKITDRGEVWPGVCPVCHNNVMFRYATIHKSFRLYFIPLVPYGRKHYLVCPICSKGSQLGAGGVAGVAQAQQLLGRYRAGTMTQEQYVSELNSLRNPPAELPSEIPNRDTTSPEIPPDVQSPMAPDSEGTGGVDR
jgi:hypothetical protein